MPVRKIIAPQWLGVDLASGPSKTVITVAGARWYEEDEPIVFTGHNLPIGLLAGTTYYVRPMTADSFTIAWGPR